MKILLTGGAGFIGSHIIEDLHKKHEFVIVDDLSTGHLDHISLYRNHTFVHGSITDNELLKKLFHEQQFEAVIHLAAIASVFKCVEDPLAASEVNFRASIQLMDLAYKHGVETFIFASSAAVYGDDPRLPKSEIDSTTLPISTYGVDKFAAEQFLMDYSRRGKLKGTAFRFFNVFGDRQDPGSPYSGVLSIFADRIIPNENPSVTIFGDGTQTRDFIYVKDIVKGIETALENDGCSSEVLNLGTGEGISLLEVISTFENLTGKKVKVLFEESRIGDIKASYCDNHRAKALSWKPNFSFKEGLQKYIESFNS